MSPSMLHVSKTFAFVRQGLGVLGVLPFGPAHYTLWGINPQSIDRVGNAVVEVEDDAGNGTGGTVVESGGHLGGYLCVALSKGSVSGV